MDRKAHYSAYLTAFWNNTKFKSVVDFNAMGSLGRRVALGTAGYSRLGFRRAYEACSSKGNEFQEHR